MWFNFIYGTIWYFPLFYNQGTKKFRSDSPGQVNFVVGLVEFILHFLDGQVKVFGEIFLWN